MKNKILLVDDHKSAIYELLITLQNNDYEVLEARDGLEGLSLLENNLEIKLVISDHYMPNMDGLTMCEKIRENQELNSVVIFMATTEVSPEAKTRGKNAGVKAWITKPYDPELVLKVIKQIGI
ncbi:MAG: response regulator [Oligoflexia bacterium]|nr:response regulator [Oligoflexia bacterium]